MLWLILGCLGLLRIHHADAMHTIGVNYGQLGDNLPSPQKAVQLIKDMKIGKVKIYDANPAILKELADSTIKVSVMLPNQQIVDVATNKTYAEAFIRTNITSFYPRTRIRTLLVGNEILSATNEAWPYLVPAMINLHKALRAHKIQKIKVSTPLAMNLLQGSPLPPSNASLRNDMLFVLKPMLRFLRHTRTPFFLDVYPFLTRETYIANFSLDFALFSKIASIYTDPGSGLKYHNLLDLSLDAVFTALSKIGYPDIRLTISETGWPTKEGLDERGASIRNAALYNRRLVKKVLAKPPKGTPLRRGVLMDTYIFALFNENLKPGPITERNWGLLYPNGTSVYQIDLTGWLNESDYKPLPYSPAEPAPGTLKLWCVANPDVNMSTLGAALSYACGEGSADCSLIQKGKACFYPNTILSHASYAFNDYYHKFKSIGGTCIFNGAANLTEKDPSYGSCKYQPTIV